MSLPLPVLDDRRYADLVEEATSLIPAYQPEWTDYNPSDPGITLIELFAWLAEMLIYRADQVPERHVRAFLRLLDPNADTLATDDLGADVTAAITALRQEYRAVTCADYEAHALAIDGVARARCVPLRDMSPAVETDRLQPAPAHISVIVVPGSGAPADLTTQVANDLQSRRLITTHVSVVDPVWTPVAIRALLARRPDVTQARVLELVGPALAELLDPLSGGADGAGWPFGRPVYIAELINCIETIAEIDHVVDIDITSQCDPNATRCVAGTALIASNGSLIGIEPGQQALPQLSGAVDASSAAQFLAVTANVSVTLAANVDPGTEPNVAAAVVRAVKDLTWPDVGWPGGGNPVQLDTGQIRTAVLGVAGVAAIQSVTLSADLARLLTATNGDVSVVLRPLELVELTVDVNLAPPS